MELLLTWALFPLVLVALGLGWGMLVERLAGVELDGALLVPTGLAATLVLAGTVTAFAATAPAAVPLCALGAAVGLVLAWPGRRRFALWPVLAALAVLLVYGAPVLLSGEATFTGFLKLDDTATWFNVIDHVMSHARSVSGEAPSTYRLVFTGDVGSSYPLGSFVLPGVARGLTGIDIAWVFQPYLACCAAALAACLYALTRPLVASARLRALVAFIAAQSALLFGYSLWGGIKELTAAFLLALGAALAGQLMLRGPRRWRELVPLALAAGALIQTLGIGAAGWVAPALLILAVAWLRRTGAVEPRREALRALAGLAVLSAAFIVPVWIVVGDFFSNKGGLFAGLFSSGQTLATRLGNLLHPLSVFQLAGIWPVRDFRLTAPAWPTALLVALVLALALVGLWMSVRARQPGLVLYVVVALAGCGVLYLAGSTPWVVGKALAISSPALLAAALTGAGAWWGGARGRAGVRVVPALAVLVLGGGVLWSNVLGYSDVTLAPRARLAELEHIGKLVAGKGPTFVNQYEVYADRHFLRAGAPVEPAEYRIPDLALRNGVILTKSAAADLDSFPLSTLEPYRSLVIERSPVESRPPSSYHLVWRGAYYELWQRPAHPATRVLEHVALGESNTYPYCGVAQNGPVRSPCSIDPVAVPSCPQVKELGREASSEHATLLAYQRPQPIVARGDQTLWPGRWIHDEAEHTLTATVPGTAVSHIAVASDQRYELWLGGSFGRGFEVSVDGRKVGRVKDELYAVAGYVHVANLLLSAGVHTFALTYPHADLTPGSIENELTSLSAIALEPMQSPTSELLSVPPGEAAKLCGRPLDWIEIVTAG